MKRIAIITARKGSKRIPQKNIREFCGKPILAYPIEAAVRSGCFEEVMVSTDSEEIATIARKYGAKVPFFRSAKNSDDMATSSDAVAETLMRYEKAGHIFDVVMCLYPTAAFVTSKRLEQAIELFESSEADTLVPVVRFSFPPQRGFKMENGRLQLMYRDFQETRSQDLEPIFHDAGQYYLAKVPYFMKYRRFYSETPLAQEIPESEVQDIDTLEDWKIAEMKYCMLHKGETEI